MSALEEYLKAKLQGKKNLGWYLSIIFVILGLIVIAILKFITLKDKLAKEETKNALADDNKKDAELAVKLQEIDKTRNSALESANEHHSEANDLNTKANIIEAKENVDKSIINQIDSWDELDKKTKFKD